MVIGFKPSSYHESREMFLREEVREIDNYIELSKAE